MDLWHNVKRFFGSLRPGPPPREDLAWAEGHLLPAEVDLWRVMSNPDKRHALRVAHRVEAALGADAPRPVMAAALLHDVGRAEELRSGVCHAQYSASVARDVLRAYPAMRVEAVAQAIAEHRFRGEKGPSNLEARVLYDADKLDAIGAIGVARAYAIAGVRRQRLWAAVSPAYAERPPQAGREDLGAEEHTPVHEYLFKLAKLRERMYTATGRQLAEGRHAYMVGYFDRLEREVNGDI